jgi:formate/nitrite transporter FocA (FNT family)
MHLPTDEQALYVWMAVLAAVYLAAAYAIQFKFKGLSNQDKYALTRVFDATTFAGSTMLLLGLTEPAVLTAIGSTKPFLFVAGFAGITYCLHALKPR